MADWTSASHQQIARAIALLDPDSADPGVNATILALARLLNYYNSTLMESEEQPPTIQLINLYCILPIVLLGTVGNLLSIAVFRCTKLRRVSASYYLTTLSISDTGFLLNLLALWLELVGVPAYNQPLLCQFLTYLTYVCCFLSPWLVVIFTVERFVATCYPLWRAVICTVARAKAIVVLLVVLACLSYLYIPFVIGEAPGNGTEAALYCRLRPAHHSTMRILNALDTVVTMVLPVILILALNVRIALAIWHFEHVRRRMTNAGPPGDDGNSGSVEATAATQLNAPAKGAGCTHYQVKITKMLLLISSVFIGLNAPSYVVRLMVYFLSEKEAAAYEDLHRWCQLGYSLNFSINFLLYCVSGQNFRKALRSLLWKVAHKAKHRQLSRSNTGTMVANCNNSTMSNTTMAIGLVSACQPCQATPKSASIPEQAPNGKDAV